MSKYTIQLSRKVEKQLDKLSDVIANPILEAIGNLGNNPRPQDVKNLTNVMAIAYDKVITALFMN